MDRVRYMQEERTSVSVLFIEFLRLNSKGKIVAFFEGEDEKYYLPKINSVLGSSNWSGVVCGGKSNVLEVRENVREHEVYGNSECMFFIDADFDDNSFCDDKSDVYITPGHSVENFYFSESLISQVLSVEFKLREEGEEREKFECIMSLFKELSEEFIAAIKPYNVMVDNYQNAIKSGQLNGGLNLKNIGIENLVDISLGTVSSLHDFTSYRALFPDLRGDIENVDLNDRFGEEKNHMQFRGKENMEFIRVFLLKLKTDRTSRRGQMIFERRSKVSLQLVKGGMLSELSNYADYPECLRRFLNSYS